jgi:hypothetical protein
VNITGECPPSLRKQSAYVVFNNCPNLVPQPVLGETLGEFFDRAVKINSNSTTRKRLNRGVGSHNLTKLSVGGKTRRYKKRKAQKTRRV